jgi:hypothetical protein
VEGKIKCLVPRWEDVKAFKEHQTCAEPSRSISEAEFINRYRDHIKGNWQAVKQWMDSLGLADELYLCCWEQEGFCHRYLVAKLLQKFRPDLEVRVT